jgi:hypothetical protein
VFQSRAVSYFKVSSGTVLDHENLRTLTLKCEKTSNCSFIHLCAESKGVFLANFLRLLAVTAYERTFMLTDVAYWSLLLSIFDGFDGE